jgi:hypothetical protein
VTGGGETSPLRPPLHRANRVEPRERKNTSLSRPPMEVKASCRQTSQRAQPGHANVARHRFESRNRPGKQRRGARRAPADQRPDPGPRARVRSSEARAARRGEAPRRQRRAFVERSGDRPVREGQAEHEDLPLQGSVSMARNKEVGRAGVLARHATNRAEIKGARSSGRSRGTRLMLVRVDTWCRDAGNSRPAVPAQT